MGHPVADNLDLLSHFADVIMGSNAHANGDSFVGIPGVLSNDPNILAADDALQVIVEGGSTTILDTFDVWADGLWASEFGPPYFLYCTSTGQIANLHKVRRITAWDNTAQTFTTDAWPVAVDSGDQFTLYEGFARLPDAHDINAVNLEDTDVGGHDRFFSLDFADEGEDRDRRGAGVTTRQTELIITLRLLHYDRQARAKKAAMINAAIIREGIMHESNRTGTNLRGVLAGGSTSKPIVDERKSLIEIRIPIVYRMSTAF